MKKRFRIYLETGTDLNNFVNICSKVEFPIYLVDKNNTFRVSAKSTLGCILAKIEWDEVYCEYDEDDNYIENQLRSKGFLDR